MTRTSLSIILAAGEGTRMRSARVKVLHEVAGRSLVGHVMASVAKAGGDAFAVVVGRDKEAVATEVSRFSDDAILCEQTERLGTGHAVLSAADAIARGFDDILVLFGDSPLISAQTITRMREKLADGAGVVVMGFRTDAPTGYGRLIIENGELVAIREEKDASEDERKIDFCNGGIMGIDGARALEWLRAIKNDNAKGEYYLTDIVAIARADGAKVIAEEVDPLELMGVNDRNDLASIEAIWQAKRRSEVLSGGVTMQAPNTVYFSADTEIGPDTVIEPDVWFGPGCKIGSNVTIRAFSHLEGADVQNGASIGPFARLRPGTQLGTGARIGNFCETKNAQIADGAKINHLTYIGDAIIGTDSNIGAGTITCNYDGSNKHLTRIGAGAFIGSNSALVAPVTINDGAYVASGSVVTKDVPEDALAVARARQENKEGYGAIIRRRNAALKAAKKEAQEKKTAKNKDG